MMNPMIDKDKVCILYAEYLEDPNCWPELWIAGENVNEAERALFIELVLNNRLFNRALDDLEKLHP